MYIQSEITSLVLELKTQKEIKLAPEKKTGKTIIANLSLVKKSSFLL